MRPAFLVLVVSSVFAQAQPPPGDKTEAARATEAAAVAKKAAEAYKVTTGEAGRGRLAARAEVALAVVESGGGLVPRLGIPLDREGEAAGGRLDLQEVRAAPPPPGDRIPLADRGPGDSREGRARRVVARPGRGQVPAGPGRPAPADTPARRLRQLRAMAAEFSATKTDRKALTRPLRLLTQPVYRYESTDPDGALFAFVEGTDPEVFLLIEARAGDKGPAWHYALARMNSVEFHVAHRGREVWSVPVIPWSQARNPREPYTLIIFLPGEGVNPPE